MYRVRKPTCRAPMIMAIADAEDQWPGIGMEISL
jgi:hypothetical protein